jgi:hypothetical protein
MPVVCTSDLYTPCAESYDTVEDFLAMCLACFGDSPSLLETSEGVWTDRATGEVVLRLEDAL